LVRKKRTSLSAGENKRETGERLPSEGGRRESEKGGAKAKKRDRVANPSKKRRLGGEDQE